MPEVAEPIKVKPVDESASSTSNRVDGSDTIESLRARLDRAEARSHSGVQPLGQALSQTSEDIALSAVEPGIIHGLRSGTFSREQYPHIADKMDEAEGINA